MRPRISDSPSRQSIWLALSLWLSVSAGCGVDFAYLIPAATGQLDILRRSVPVEDALASGQLDAETTRRLNLVQAARAFARDAIGLNVGTHYTTFYDSGGEPVAFNISASRRDRFEPFLWTFPFVGTVPFLGYFNLDSALAKREELHGLGYDVFIYEVDAYYALGLFPNPILSPMLNRPEESLIDTVIHELVHATIIRPNDTAFNESLATFIGRTGAVQFLERHYTDEPERRELALARFADADRFSEFMLELYLELDGYFRSDLSSKVKIFGRETIYRGGRERFTAEVVPLLNHPENFTWVADLPVNNAYMLGIRRYNLDLDAFDRVFQAVDRDWASALAVYAQAAAAPDAYAFLRAWPSGTGTLRTGAVPVETATTPGFPHDFTGCDLHRATTLIEPH